MRTSIPPDDAPVLSVSPPSSRPYRLYRQSAKLFWLAQLTCQGPGCKVFQPDVVQCTNMGDDGLGNVQWKVCPNTLEKTHTYSFDLLTVINQTIV